MKLISIIHKSYKEQLRHFWILLLTITMAPFFVFVYYLIVESSKPHYDLLLLNLDVGVTDTSDPANYGHMLLEASKIIDKESIVIPLTVHTIKTREEGLNRLKNRKADTMVILPTNFSQSVQNAQKHMDCDGISIEFVGDLTNLDYMLTAISVNELLQDFIYQVLGRSRPIVIEETGLGFSGKVDDFDLVVPGILILSVIMLMFTATIALTTEVENKTIIRLKLSRINALEFLTGVGIIQIIVGVISVLLTMWLAVNLGFEYAGSLLLLLLLAVLTSVSMIAFSLIVAAVTKSVNEVLVIGNFPLFLFMFFTGAAFPLESKTLFTVFSYPVTLNGLMSPTHAVNAMKKVLIMDMGLGDIMPEIIALLFITIGYFIIGVWGFHRRHMRVRV